MAALRSRRLAAALLWFALALLPLRGFAAALMPAAAVGTVAATAVASDVDAPPCHGTAEGATPALHHAADDGATATPLNGDCPTCALCALCHGGFVDAAPAAVRLPALTGDAPPAAAPAAIEPRAPDALFRPPRPRLA